MNTPLQTNISNARSSFFNEADEIFMITDEHLNILDVNAKLLKSIKMKSDQLIGKNLHEIDPDLKKSERYKKYLEVLKTGKTITINEVKFDTELKKSERYKKYLEILKKNKKATVKEVKLEPLLELGNKTIQIRIFKIKKGLAITALDITNLTNTKRKLKTTKSEFQKTNQKLTKMNNDLEDFSYIVAHDLKGPINNLKILFDLLSKKKEKLHENKRYNKLLKTVDQLNKNTYSLNNVIALKYYLQEKKEIVNFEDTFNDVVDNISDSINNSNTLINTDFSECSLIKYPPKQLYKILFHLINNSINFRNTIKNKNIINISTHKKDNKIIFIIKDNGIGFDQIKNKNRIFKIYYKANKSSQGLGIGLYVVKSIIDFHHGKIKVFSQINEGTTFKLTLI